MILNAFDSRWWRLLISSRDGRVWNQTINAMDYLMDCTRRLSFCLWKLSECGRLGWSSDSGLPMESGNLWTWSSGNLATCDFGSSYLWVFLPMVLVQRVTLHKSRELGSTLCESDFDSRGALRTVWWQFLLHYNALGPTPGASGRNSSKL